MAIRPPKSNSQGFTLIEMLVTIAVAGIIMGFAIPSFLSLNKPLRDASVQFKSQLSLIRSKAISSNKAYRIRPRFTLLTDYPDGRARNFVVEYADNCKTPENNAAPAKLRWQMASELDLDLPPNIGLPVGETTLPVAPVTSANSLDWTTPGKSICFNNRGIIEDINTKIVLRDFQGFNKARLAWLELTTVGNVDINTYSSTNIPIPAVQDNPQF